MGELQVDCKLQASREVRINGDLLELVEGSTFNKVTPDGYFLR